MALLLFTLGLGAAALRDLQTRRLDNLVTAPLLAGGLVARASELGIGGLESGILGALTGAALLTVPFALHAVGGGDLKLLAAIGAWLGPMGAARVLVGGAILAGVVALAMLTCRPQLRAAVLADLRGGRTMRSARALAGRPSGWRLPLGLPLAAVACWIACHTTEFLHA